MAISRRTFSKLTLAAFGAGALGCRMISDLRGQPEGTSPEEHYRRADHRDRHILGGARRTRHRPKHSIGRATQGLARQALPRAARHLS